MLQDACKLAAMGMKDKLLSQLEQFVLELNELL